MTSGLISRLTLISLAVVASATTTASDLDADALLSRLVRPAPDSTAFVEIRYSELLKSPVVVSGQLAHREDGSLVRTVEVPFHEVTTLHEGSVTVEREGGPRRRFSLERAPELRGLLASFGAILQGDRDLLDRHFSVVVNGDDDRWAIELSPIDDAMRRRVMTILIDGSADRPECFRLNEPDGDATIMLLGLRDISGLPAPAERRALEAWCKGERGGTVP
jgi:hypothetical protein